MWESLGQRLGPASLHGGACRSAYLGAEVCKLGFPMILRLHPSAGEMAIDAVEGQRHPERHMIRIKADIFDPVL